jgi:hypothetical protein
VHAEGEVTVFTVYSMIPAEEEPTDNSELWSLAEAVCNGTITAEQYARLNPLLLADEDAARRYATYVRMHGLLLWRWQDADVAPASVQALPVVFDPPSLPGVSGSLFAGQFSPGGYLFSYLLAAFIVGIGLLIGWEWQVSNSRLDHQDAVQVAPQPAPAGLRPEPELVSVGRVTGMVDCQWADPKTATVNGARVALGQKYLLAAGLLQISYDTGARAILQGPCIYEVESRHGGFLALGRLTAKVEKRDAVKGERGARSGESEKVVANQQSTIDNHKSPSPLSPLPSPLFVVRTPTAKVTDLGTEFGVEVDASGVSKAHVYEGKVEMQAVGGGNARAILLRANESARAETGKNGVVAVIRQTGQKSTLFRDLPKSASIVLFNTGLGLKGGDPDPHWQIAARSDDPGFKPQTAVVRGWRDETFLPDDPHSKWISLLPGAVEVPQDVVYVFRTTFDLSGMLPATAVVRGKFMGDDRVIAIRLNGRRLSVPVHQDTGPFFEWAKFQVSSGFVRGKNVLEFDVLNSNPAEPPGQRRILGSRMSFRAELEGQAARDPGLPSAEALGRALRTSAKDGQTATAPKWLGKKVVGMREMVMRSAGRRWGGKRGTGPICRNGPEGASHKLDLSPFSQDHASLFSTCSRAWKPSCLHCLRVSVLFLPYGQRHEAHIERFRFYLGRVARGDYDHRHSDRTIAAGRAGGARGGQEIAMR